MSGSQNVCVIRFISYKKHRIDQVLYRQQKDTRREQICRRPPRRIKAMGARLRSLSVIKMLTLFGMFSMVYLISIFSDSSRYLNRPISNVDSVALATSHHDHRLSPINHDPNDALILTYMRSGSSFVGKVLGWRKDTFYWYEPMWKTHRWLFLSGDHLKCNYKKPGCYTISGNTLQSVDRTLKFFLDVYKCDNLTQHWERYGKIQTKSTVSGPTGLAFEECMRMPSGPGLSNKSHSEKACFETVMERCPNAKHRVLKALRLETAHAQFLLEQHERLKLVQIFRDPRAVIYSRQKTKWYYHKEDTTESDVQILCQRMSKDIKDFEKLRTLYPERVKILQYEDFNDPRRLAIHLYTFLNMEMTKSADHLLQTLARNDKASVGGFHPDSYRSSLDWKIIQFTTKYCRSVLERLGLRIFKNEGELRNISLNVVLGSLPFKID